MEINDNKELKLIARYRVSPPYRKRMYVASIIAGAAIIGSSIPSGRGTWQIIVWAVVMALYIIYVAKQHSAIDYKAMQLFREFKREL